jgi:serine/threonine protein kinase
LGQPCAIKQFLPQFLFNQSGEATLMQKAIALFESEAAQLKELGSHPQIPELIAYFEENGYLYLVQELIEGENLYNELQTKGLFNETQIYQLLDEMLPVLQFIHDRQVIHRDIKPDNIIRKKLIANYELGITNYELAVPNFVLVDFGAAKSFVSNTANRTGTLIGSAEYVAPEQARGKAVPQSDLYSLGVTCIHLLTGISPFDLYDDVRDRWIWRDQLTASISNHLAAILDRLLEKAIANRYGSANEALNALRSPDITSIMLFGIPYQSELKEALSFGQWQEGDRLTNKIILELAAKDKIAKLTANDISQISCEVWIAIDQAWMQASNNRFGWNVQKQVWQDLGGKLIYTEDTYWQFADVYEKFSDRVGWRKPRWLKLGISPKIWRKYENLIFEINAPRGHLPSLLFWEGFNLVDAVFYRLEICDAQV